MEMRVHYTSVEVREAVQPDSDAHEVLLHAVMEICDPEDEGDDALPDYIQDSLDQIGAMADDPEAIAGIKAQIASGGERANPYHDAQGRFCSAANESPANKQKRLAAAVAVGASLAKAAALYKQTAATIASGKATAADVKETVAAAKAQTKSEAKQMQAAVAASPAAQLKTASDQQKAALDNIRTAVWQRNSDKTAAAVKSLEAANKALASPQTTGSAQDAERAGQALIASLKRYAVTNDPKYLVSATKASNALIAASNVILKNSGLAKLAAASSVAAAVKTPS